MGGASPEARPPEGARGGPRGRKGQALTLLPARLPPVPSPPSWAPGWTSTRRTSFSPPTSPASGSWWPTCSSTCPAPTWSAGPTSSWPSWSTWTSARQSRRVRRSGWVLDSGEPPWQSQRVRRSGWALDSGGRPHGSCRTGSRDWPQTTCVGTAVGDNVVLWVWGRRLLRKPLGCGPVFGKAGVWVVSAPLQLQRQLHPESEVTGARCGFLHGLESNPGSSLQTEEEAGLP